jgi:Meiotically up-regulated gene 113
VEVYGFVYFVQGRDGGPIKIGFARKDVYARVWQIQAMCPVELKVLVSIPARNTYERYLHRQFADDRLHGEWFNPSKRILRHIERVKEAVKGGG